MQKVGGNKGLAFDSLRHAAFDCFALRQHAAQGTMLLVRVVGRFRNKFGMTRMTALIYSVVMNRGLLISVPLS